MFDLKYSDQILSQAENLLSAYKSLPNDLQTPWVVREGILSVERIRNHNIQMKKRWQTYVSLSNIIYWLNNRRTD